MSNNKPLRANGYEIDRKSAREIERQIRLYPIRKRRYETLEAKYAGFDPDDYAGYRSPQVDGMPGAPGKVGDPTGNSVVEMLAETQNLAYLRRWVSGMDYVMEERLDSIQRTIVTEYLMVPPHLRQKSLIAVLAEHNCPTSQSQAYHWMNRAIMEFAHLLLDEKNIRDITGKTPESNTANP